MTSNGSGKPKRSWARKPENEFFARQLDTAIRQAGLSRQEFQDRIGIAHSTVSKWLNAGQRPRPADMQRIADTLARPVSYFVDEETQTTAQEAAYRLTVRFLERVMAGESLVGAIEVETGDPTLMDHAARRRLTAREAVLRDWIRSRAPRAWEQMDAAAQAELLLALVREPLPPPVDERRV